MVHQINRKLLRALEAVVESARNGNEPGQRWIMVAGGLIDSAEEAVAEALKSREDFEKEQIKDYLSLS